MNSRALVEKVLRGGHGKQAPFTMYESKIPQCETERLLRNRGLCIVERNAAVFKTITPNVKITGKTYTENGATLTRAWYETPVGTLTTLNERAGFTTWHHEKMFKSPDDYKALLFLIEDERYVPNYDAFRQAEKSKGGDFILRANIGLEPLQHFITSGSCMKMDQFCIEWMDNRDEILKLYRALVHKHRERYKLVADSPASHANYGGNVTPAVVSPAMFREYYLPHYQEAAEILHKAGKLIGSHLDANCRLLSPLIAESALDYIEAFTPAPDTDMTLAEARAAWPDKVLWINYPSSLHLKPPPEVERFAFEMLDSLKTIDGLIVGITEDIPEERWQASCTAIMDGLERHARERPELYK